MENGSVLKREFFQAGGVQPALRMHRGRPDHNMSDDQMIVIPSIPNHDPDSQIIRGSPLRLRQPEARDIANDIPRADHAAAYRV